MIKCGITGGIGSGKTTVSALFKELGIPIFNSDLCAREAEKEPHIQKGFKEILGEDIFVDGELDRVKMREIVFNDKNVLDKIQKLIKPYIKQKFDKFCSVNSNAAIIILESAILFETKSNEEFDYIITVTASENTRIKRVLTRDGITLEEVMNKIKNQLPEMDKIIESDFVVINEGHTLSDGLVMLTKQINCIRKAIVHDMMVDSMDLLNKVIKE